MGGKLTLRLPLAVGEDVTELIQVDGVKDLLDHARDLDLASLKDIG